MVCGGIYRKMKKIILTSILIVGCIYIYANYSFVTYRVRAKVVAHAFGDRDTRYITILRREDGKLEEKEGIEYYVLRIGTYVFIREERLEKDK